MHRITEGNKPLYAILGSIGFRAMGAQGRKCGHHRIWRIVIDGKTRREWLHGVPGAMGPLAAMRAAGQSGASKQKPNVVLIVSDQFRWDCIGAMGLHPLGLTPNLAGMARG